MNLRLRTTKKNGRHPLYTKMNIGGEATWVNLRMLVDVCEWNDATQSERKLTNYLNKKGLNKKLALIEDAVANMRRHHRLTKENVDNTIKDIVSADKRDELKRVETLRKEQEEKKKRNIENFVIEYIKGIESGEVRTAKKERYTKETCKNWRQFKRVFLEYYRRRPFEWEDINESLVDSFFAYLESKGYMKYTIDKHISKFKALVGAAERKGMHSNHAAIGFLRGPQIRENDKTKKIYLTKEELTALYEMNLTGFDEQVRDVFLIGCFTAMRYSDYSRIKKSNIGFTNSGTKVIRISQEKTDGIVVVPILDDRLEQLLKKYNYNVPRIWDQSINRTIKQICKKLSETVPSLRKKETTILTLKERKAEDEAKQSGVNLYEYDENDNPLKPRWELVSTHTARRSCITNMYLSKKYTVQQIMSVSGHQTESSFRQYVKLSLDEYADGVAIAAKDGLF